MAKRRRCKSCIMAAVSAKSGRGAFGSVMAVEFVDLLMR